MKKKKLLMIGCIAVVLLLSVSVAISASTKKSTEMLAGELYHDLQTQSDETVLATYRGQPITADVVAYTVSMNELYGDDTTEISASTDKVKHAIDGIVESMILLEEAERQGLEATDEEIEATIENAKLAYEIPEGKQMLDEYCAAMEISFEEYLEILAEQSPRVIARQKLRDAYGQAYCEEYGLEFTKVNPPEQMEQAVSRAIEKLVSEHQQYVVYYLEQLQ